MGLSAAQAKYLFISSRIIDVQGALMTNSMKQLALTDKSSDIAEAKEYALNAQQWQFNGNAQFDYNTLMDNEYFVVTNDDKNRVVLNGLYAAAANSAKVNPNGGAYSVEGLNTFMMAMGQKPSQKSQLKGFTDWTYVAAGQVQNNKATIEAQQAAKAAKEVELKNAKNDFYAVNGLEPKQGIDPARTIKHPAEYKDMTISEILEKMGNTNNFNNISNLDGRSTKGTQTINEQTNVDGSFANLVNGDGYVCLIDDQEDLSYEQIWSRAQKGFENLANNIINKIAQATGISDLPNKLKSTVDAMKNQINGNLSTNSYHREKKARNGGRDDAKNSVIGVAIDKTATDQVWVYCNPAELTRRLLTATANIFKKEGSSNPAALTKVQNGKTTLNKNALVSQVVKEAYDETFPYINEKGKTYEEWHAAYNALSQELKNYMENGTVPGTIDSAKFNYPEDQDKATLEKYQRIFQKICSQGWTEDKDLAQDKLANKLENAQYLIQYQDNKAATMSMFAEFEKVNANNKDDIERYYDAEERKIKSEEKRLGVEQTSLQTELSSLQTEEASVKSIIDKNVERGFNLFG